MFADNPQLPQRIAAFSNKSKRSRFQTYERMFTVSQHFRGNERCDNISFIILENILNGAKIDNM